MKIHKSTKMNIKRVIYILYVYTINNHKIMVVFFRLTYVLCCCCCYCDPYFCGVRFFLALCHRLRRVHTNCQHSHELHIKTTLFPKTSAKLMIGRVLCSILFCWIFANMDMICIQMERKRKYQNCCIAVIFFVSQSPNQHNIKSSGAKN